MIFIQDYSQRNLQETDQLGSARAKANVNIALIKYWGKVDSEENLPAVGSLSLTLDEWGSETRVTWYKSTVSDVAEHRFILNGQERPDPKVNRLLDRLLELAEQYDHAWAKPKQVWALVESMNTVPTASGLASSASGMAALGLAAWSSLAWANPFDKTQADQFSPACEHLIDLVRIGSGSAVRSLLGGLVRLERDGRRMKQLQDAHEWSLALVVAVVDPGPKAVSSREGMERTRQTSPYYQAWVDSHEADLNAAEIAVKQKDLRCLGELMEHSTFKMHSVMWASRPPLIFWNSATIACMQMIRKLQQEGLNVFFTIDAGPQVKAICLKEDSNLVRKKFEEVSGVKQVMQSSLGAAVRLVEST